jgi:hypothetical protein
MDAAASRYFTSSGYFMSPAAVSARLMTAPTSIARRGG